MRPTLGLSSVPLAGWDAIAVYLVILSIPFLPASRSFTLPAFAGCSDWPQIDLRNALLLGPVTLFHSDDDFSFVVYPLQGDKCRLRDGCGILECYAGRFQC